MISARRAFELQAAKKLETLVQTAASYLCHVDPTLERDGVVARATDALAPFVTVDEDTLSALELSSVRVLQPSPRTGRRVWSARRGHGADAATRAAEEDLASRANVSRLDTSRGVAAADSPDMVRAGSGGAGAANTRRSRKQGRGPGRQQAQVEAAESPPPAPPPQTVQAKYFFDQENLADPDAAFVQWTAKDPGLLQVVCPVGTHLRRRRYIRVLGTALFLHMAQQGRRSMRVEFVPPQVNGVVALGCLGLFLQPHQPGAFTLLLDWPSPPATSGAWPLAQDWQFCTLWHEDDDDDDEKGGGEKGAFRSSYFDMIAGSFRWAWRDSPFKSAVVALKRKSALALRHVDWEASTASVPADTEVYGEYSVEGAAAPASFFGTVGDVRNKRALLPPGSPGRAAIDSMRAYFLHPSKPAALAEYLNERAGSGGPRLVADRDLRGLPEAALANFAKIWTPQMLKLVRALVSASPALAESIVHHVPLDVRDYVRPPAGPLAATVDDTVLAVMKSISLYPDLAPKVLSRT